MGANRRSDGPPQLAASYRTHSNSRLDWTSTSKFASDLIHRWTPEGWNVPRYYFCLRWPKRRKEQRDERGIVLLDDARARKYAERVIRELKESGGFEDPGLRLIVRNEAGKKIFVLPFGTRQ
jgi:hypothetical protein